jgi:hypothetical protein
MIVYFKLIETAAAEVEKEECYFCFGNYQGFKSVSSEEYEGIVKKGDLICFEIRQISRS